MLTPEQAAKALERFQVADWESKRLARIGKLSKKLRACAYPFANRDAEGKELGHDWNVRTAAPRAAVKTLDQLSRAQRLKVFAALCPKLAPQIEGAWQLLQRLPYQTGYTRRPFRAPQNPESSIGKRAGFLEGAADLVSSYDGQTGYDEDVVWLAAWAPHLPRGQWSSAPGYLLAAAIDAGGAQADAVLEILRASARNEHEVGAMGHHVTRALLTCSRPDAWQFVENLLIAAQRQEGLRQAVLETVDEAHPEAFRRMLRLILDNDLGRFSAVVRAVDVWFGF